VSSDIIVANAPTVIPFPAKLAGVGMVWFPR
jgi:hypothetical protein